MQKRVMPTRCRSAFETQGPLLWLFHRWLWVGAMSRFGWHRDNGFISKRESDSWELGIAVFRCTKYLRKYVTSRFLANFLLGRLQVMVSYKSV